MSPIGIKAVCVAMLTDPVRAGNSNFETEIKFKAKINCQMRSYLLKYIEQTILHLF